MDRKLLIIDDNKDVVDIIKIILLDMFDSVHSANSVESAVELLRTNSYSLVFLDIGLADRNGAEVVKYLIESENNPNKNTSFIIISGMITPDFIDKFHKRFSGILMKPFEHDDIRQITENALYPPVKPEPGNNSSVCELPFPMVQFGQRVSKILETTRGLIRSNQLLTGLTLDRKEGGYAVSHISILINVSAAILTELEWASDKTLEKFIYAAYLHDMALIDRPDLIRISSRDELEDVKESLCDEDYELVLNHPQIAANSIVGIPGIPADISIILTQHHELPKRNGFPLGLGYPKIAPLAAVFIVAHDFADYVLINKDCDLAHPKRVVEQYLNNSINKFQGSQFTRILKALSNYSLN